VDLKTAFLSPARTATIHSFRSQSSARRWRIECSEVNSVYHVRAIVGEPHKELFGIETVPIKPKSAVRMADVNRHTSNGLCLSSLEFANSRRSTSTTAATRQKQVCATLEIEVHAVSAQTQVQRGFRQVKWNSVAHRTVLEIGQGLNGQQNQAWTQSTEAGVELRQYRKGM
jgi:hypothetical protein